MIVDVQAIYVQIGDWLLMTTTIALFLVLRGSLMLFRASTH